jgi:hypothetical protein
MNPELKHKWTAALRSGEYGQSSCVLKDDNGFCCLGVLCDIINKDGWAVNEEGDNIFDGEVYLLSDNMRKIAGISDDDCNRLIRLNDVLKYTFPQIADCIDESF